MTSMDTTDQYEGGCKVEYFSNGEVVHTTRFRPEAGEDGLVTFVNFELGFLKGRREDEDITAVLRNANGEVVYTA